MAPKRTTFDQRIRFATRQRCDQILLLAWNGFRPTWDRNKKLAESLTSTPGLLKKVSVWGFDCPCLGRLMFFNYPESHWLSRPRNSILLLCQWDELPGSSATSAPCWWVLFAWPTGGSCDPSGHLATVDGC